MILFSNIIYNLYENARTSTSATMIKKIFTLFCFLLMSFSAFSQNKLHNIENIATRFKIPAIQVVHNKANESHSYFYGVKRNGEHDIIDNETIFQAASLTKVITAYAFFKLYDAGLIDLDTPLYHYYQYDRLSESEEGQKITARMVLTHRTGLLNWEGAVSTKEWRESKLHLQFTPDTDYMYSGEGFYYLQLTMEEITGKSFNQLIEELIIEPFEMIHSKIVWDEKLAENAAYGHLENAKPRDYGRYMSPNAAYTLYTTAEDYSKFITKGLNNGLGLKSETHQLLISKADEVRNRDEKTLALDAKVPTALGLRIQINEKGNWLWHTGSNPGFRAFFITHPENNESLTVFMNAESGFSAMPLLLETFLGQDQTFWAYLWRKGELD